MIVVLDLLRLHGSANASVAEKGFRTVVNLSSDSSNSRRLGEAGAVTGT